MKWFFDLIDLSDNLAKAVEVTRRVQPGEPSLIMGLCTLLVTGLCAALAYIFDIRATWSTTNDGVYWLTQEFLGIGVQLDTILGISTAIAVLFAFGPTLIEFVVPMWARVNVTMAQYLLYCFCVFDAITDAPVTHGFVTAVIGDMWFAYPVVFVPWLFLASYGFEMLTIIAGVCSFVLLRNSVPTQARGGGAR